MTAPFSDKLRLVLKMLSMSAAQLASEVGADKSVVSRWLTGRVQPSEHSLSRLTAVVAARLPGFRTLDWERSLESLAELFGVNPTTGAQRASPRLPIVIWDQMTHTAALRAEAYEGIFRATRPHPTMPGLFLHEHGMIRRDEQGLPRLSMNSGGTVVTGWMLPLYNQLYCIAADVTAGTLLFGIFNGVSDPRVDAFDGLVLLSSVRTPTVSGMLCERVCDLTGDRAADDRRFAELAAISPLAPEGSVPLPVQRHLLQNFGPTRMAAGGDWLVRMYVTSTMARGSWSPPPPTT